MRLVKKHKDEKSASLISRFAAEYFEVEANKDSLITVTKTDMSDRGRRASVFFTVLPRERELEALEFAKRRQKDFRQFIMSKKSFGFVPKIDFAIDEGEHNRQRIDELLNESPVENSDNKS